VKACSDIVVVSADGNRVLLGRRKVERTRTTFIHHELIVMFVTILIRLSLSPIGGSSVGEQGLGTLPEQQQRGT
jgi:hypothetical protein